MKKTAEELVQFIKESPDAFHAAAAVVSRLKESGYEELTERKSWKLESGKGYYVTRNDSAVIAFRIPEGEFSGYQVMASHSDSPSFKIKENPEMVVDNHYVKLNVEKYGGMLMAPWFDRPLSVAGRIMVKETTADGKKKIVSRLVNVDRDLLMIPSLAIHMNREVNGGYRFNVQKDLLPLYGNGGDKGTFMLMMAKEAGVRTEDILGHDLFLYNRMPGTVWGARNEFVSSPRLDDLQCTYASMEGFLRADKKRNIAVHCVLDNEEVGSSTKQGAAATFLKDVLFRIHLALGGTYEEYLMALAESFMISADNAHGLHPNYADKSDPVNRPVLNGGIVIKYNANQKYCTDGVSAAVFKELCREAEVPYQTFVNRSDMAGGSTLGNISNTQAAMNTVDIGLPQLAMHSAYETAGVKDTEYLIHAAKVFYR